MPRYSGVSAVGFAVPFDDSFHTSSMSTVKNMSEPHVSKEQKYRDNLFSGFDISDEI
jgi:hypothetical protein